MEEQRELHWTELNPACLLRRVLRELPVILAAGLTALLLTVTVLQATYHPTYTASATVAVNLKNASYATIYSNLSTTSEIAQTFTELFESKTFGELARSRFGAELPGTLAASVIPETNLLKLSVTADNPADAFRTLRFLMENYNVLSDHVFQNVILRELDSPVVPTAPSNPLSLRPAAKKAFLIGALAMMLGLLAAGVLSDTVQTAEGMHRRVDARLFATIHHETKNKTLRARLRRDNKGLLITMPVAGFYFTEEVGKLASKVSHAAMHDGRKVLMITSAAENEGKSTVAANLAISLAQKGKRVVLVDADLHKPAQYKLLRTEPKCELAQVLRGEKPCAPEQTEQADWGGFRMEPFGQAAGTSVLPGGYTPPARFVRTAFQKLHMVQPETMQEAVIAGFHILEGVTLPNGVVKTANGTFDYTQYTSMIDLPNKVYYFKTYENPQIIRVDLKPVWASGEQTVRDLGSIHVPIRYGTME